MKVLVLHNRYRQSGGEDAVVNSEIELLRSHGLEVFDHQPVNEGSSQLRNLIDIGISSSWSKSSYAEISALCRNVRPDIVHVHNFWMRLSPSVHAACHDAGIPTVQTLHNYRLLCPRADFLRNGKVCQACLGKIPLPGIVNRCYRNSFFASFAATRMIVTNRNRGTWNHEVAAYIALSHHSKTQFVSGGFPAEKIFVKTNFVEDFGHPSTPPSTSQSIVFAGRLSAEKGVGTLLRAWQRVQRHCAGNLFVIGDGPLRKELEKLTVHLGIDKTTFFVGSVSVDKVLKFTSKARAVALPSICFENCPRSILEAFCCGRPVITSDIGALKELVQDGVTGLKVPAGNENQLAKALMDVLMDPQRADDLGQRARSEYLGSYTPSLNITKLMNVYNFALTGSHTRPGDLTYA